MRGVMCGGGTRSRLTVVGGMASGSPWTGFGVFGVYRLRINCIFLTTVSPAH